MSHATASLQSGAAFVAVHSNPDRRQYHGQTPDEVLIPTTQSLETTLYVHDFGPTAIVEPNTIAPFRKGGKVGDPLRRGGKVGDPLRRGKSRRRLVFFAPCEGGTQGGSSSASALRQVRHPGD